MLTVKDIKIKTVMQAKNTEKILVTSDEWTFAIYNGRLTSAGIPADLVH